MIHVIMIIIALAAAFGIMLLAYSKDGLKYRKEEGANDYVTGFMMAVIIYFWGMDLRTFITGSAETSALTYLFVFGAPILLAVWAVYTRIKTKQQMNEPPKPHKKSSK